LLIVRGAAAAGCCAFADRARRWHCTVLVTSLYRASNPRSTVLGALHLARNCRLRVLGALL